MTSRKRKFYVHTFALIAMLAAAAGLYPAAQADARLAEWGLLGLFAIANTLILFV